MRLGTEPVTTPKGGQESGKGCGSHSGEQEDKRKGRLKEEPFRDRASDKGRLPPVPPSCTGSRASVQ